MASRGCATAAMRCERDTCAIRSRRYRGRACEDLPLTCGHFFLPRLIAMSSSEIAGQLSAMERELLTNSVLQASRKPQIVLEVGTWLGGGSTLHLLRALERN